MAIPWRKREAVFLSFESGGSKKKELELGGIIRSRLRVVARFFRVMVVTCGVRLHIRQRLKMKNVGGGVRRQINEE
ncbi:hypothetical protein Tco_0883685 [Tanacetum coccineum]